MVKATRQFKLICFDLDGVIFDCKNFWMELHKAFGTLEEGEKLTRKHLHTDYETLAQEVVGRLWKGKNAKPYYDLVDSLKYLPGVKKTFKHIKNKGYITAIVCSSSIDAAKRVQKDFGVDYIFANELVIRSGRVSGEFVWPIGAGKEKKAEKIRELCSELGISPQECMYIGDDEIDLEAFREVGVSIAFNSQSEKLKKAATAVVDSRNLSDIITYIS